MGLFVVQILIVLSNLAKYSKSFKYTSLKSCKCPHFQISFFNNSKVTVLNFHYSNKDDYFINGN